MAGRADDGGRWCQGKGMTVIGFASVLLPERISLQCEDELEHTFRIGRKWRFCIQCRFARVVKGVDLKSTAERRVGSNPAGDGI